MSQYASRYGSHSEEMKEYLAKNRSDPPSPPLDLAMMRPGYNSAWRNIWQAKFPDLYGQNFTVAAKDGYEIPVRIWWHGKPQTKRVALALHGGGWTLGDHYSDAFMTATLAKHLGLIVVSVGYRCSPEHRYPVPFEDVCAVYEWALSSKFKDLVTQNVGYSPTQTGVTLCGFSAGANLTAALSLWCREMGLLGRVASVVLISPSTCHYRHLSIAKERFGIELDSIKNASSPLLSTDMLCYFWDNYAPEGSKPPEVAFLSPLIAKSLSDLPPTYIQISGADPLRDEGIGYATRLQDAGTDVEVQIYAGMPHAFQSELIGFKAGEKALQDLVDYLTKRDIGEKPISK